MTAHFGTFTVNADGAFLDLAERVNSSADVSPTGSQMPRLVGLAYASRLTVTTKLALLAFPLLSAVEQLTRVRPTGNWLPDRPWPS